MNDSVLNCKEEVRRDLVRAASLFGLDYAEVSDDQLTISVYFLGKAPPAIEKANILLQGGTRIRGVQVVNLRIHRQADSAFDDFMEVEVNKPGDFSTYTLRVVKVDERGHSTQQPMAGFDPRYDAVDFTFKAACPSDLDCKVPPVCPPSVRTEPEINYLAKDYASFRQLILDRLALILPDWQEAHVPDLGITLVELLAYAGDYLSYYQDAVATEAYLGTARERISVRRHVRLVDYAMHDGCNARAWVTLRTGTDLQLDARAIYFITAFPGSPSTHVLNSLDLEFVPAASYEVFEPLWPAGKTINVYSAHSEILFYTWGDCRCCLPKGATLATLVDAWVPAPTSAGGDNAPSTRTTQPAGLPSGSAPPPTLDAAPTHLVASETVPPQPSDGPPGTVRALHLTVGDVLIFEEVIGPKTGNPSDADPTHRQAVRLIRVTPMVDLLVHPSGAALGQPIVEIEWAVEDALTFPLCISAVVPPPDCTCMENVSVARGNVILVDHGASGEESVGTVPTLSMTERCPTDCTPGEVAIVPGCLHPKLQAQPLTFSQPIPSGACSANAMTVQDPRRAMPALSLQSIPPAPQCAQVTTSPCSIPPLFAFADMVDPTGLAKHLKQAADPNAQFLSARLVLATQQLLAAWDSSSPLPAVLRAALIADMTSLLEAWTPLRDLLESGPSDHVFVAEMDDDGYAHLRFGDGRLGMKPAAGDTFNALWRVGNGLSGNVGAEAISYLVLRNMTLSGVNLTPRNPIRATGGTAPEPVAEVKLFAPYAFRSVLERAITREDYATLAVDNERRREERYAVLAGISPAADVCASPFVALQAAKGTLRWTGSWYEALVAIDPEGTENDVPGLEEEIAEYLEPYRRMGHDLEVRPASYVPLDVGLQVCVRSDFLRAHVEAALLDVFSDRVLPDGTLGFFHPDNLTFGEGIYVSRIVAAAQAVPGVEAAWVVRLMRYEAGTSLGGPFATAVNTGVMAIQISVVRRIQVPASGVLELGPFEIARLDNDPNYPENGRISLNLRGGR